MALYLRARGDILDLRPDAGAGAAFTLAELQQLVGGYIEVVRAPTGPAITEPVWMVLNEDGKRLRLPINELATAILYEGALVDYVVGDVLLATWAEIGGGDAD